VRGPAHQGVRSRRRTWIVRAAASVLVIVTACSTGATSAGSHAAGSPPTDVADVGCGYGQFAAGRWPEACWRPYGTGSVFNRVLPSRPKVMANSQAIVDRTLGMGRIADLVVAPDTASDWYHPVYFSAASDPAFTVRCTRPWGTCEVEGMHVQIPDAARPAAGGDAHLAVVDQATGWEYDFFEVQAKPEGGGVLEVGWGGRTPIKGSGLGSDATAAHFGLLAGVIRPQELEAGRIDHALFMMVGCTSDRYVHPATGYAAACDDPTDAPAVGQLFWLDMTAAEIDALDVPAWKKTVLHALRRYGAYVGDTGGNEAFTFQFESSTSYTSFGVEDPFAAVAREQPSGVTERGGRYYFDLGSGVDWRGRLRVLDPCVATRSCDHARTRSTKPQ